jgi:biopolymer transport protein ExbD
MARKIRQWDRPVMPVAPLIDCVFLLLIYFMVTSNLRREEMHVPFRLPSNAVQKESVVLLNRQKIQILRDGRIRHNGRTLNLSDRSVCRQIQTQFTQLQALCHSQGKEVSLILYPENAVTQDALVRVIDCFREIPIASISFDLGSE